MAGYDDDEQRAAYERASKYVHDNAVFHDIIQHYDDTARPDHDDIDFDAAGIDNLDGTEYDNDGYPVIAIGDIGTILIDFGAIILDICDAIDQFGSFQDIPDDYEFGPAKDDILFVDPSPDCDYEAERAYRLWCTRHKPRRGPDDDTGSHTPE